MHLAARRFIKWVLAIHLGLLLVVALIVIGAARSIHFHAREQAMAQATATQELLAKQTSRGIENYYQAVTSVLELLKPTQEEENGVSAALRGGPEMALLPPPPPVSGGERAGARPDMSSLRKRLIETLWKDVQQRVSLLFVLDLSNARVRPGAPPATEPAEPRLIAHDAFGDPDGLTAGQIIDSAGEWLKHVEGPTVSPFQRIAGSNCNIVAVPLRSTQTRRILIAVVPIDRLERELLANVNARPLTHAILFDGNGTVMSDAQVPIVGTNVKTEGVTPRISALAAKYMPTLQGGTEAFEDSPTIRGQKRPPSLITMEPIEFKQFPGTRWWISIASDLSEVDTVVNHIFGAATLWAVFVVISVSAILLSTGTQLIRARLRLERVQHEVLEKELNQARDIQLNWLPKEPCCRMPIDVAAVNRPANRISGDFYNWFDLADGRTVVVIGDVTGHGMAAAFLMATTQLLVRSTMTRVNDPGECLEEVNRQLCTQGFNGQFVTMTLLVLDTTQHTIHLATAGHPAPLVCDGEGFRKMEIEPELVLGIDFDARYPTSRLLLPADARIVLYTDGVIDAATRAGMRFSMAGLLSSLAKGPRFETAQGMVDAVTMAVDRFRHGQDLADDLTLVAIQLRPAPNGKSAIKLPAEPAIHSDRNTAERI